MTAASFNFNLPGYRLIEELFCDSKTVVYRAEQTGDRVGEDSRSVVIKLLSLAYPTYEDLFKFRNQYTIAKNLDVPGVVRPYRLEQYHRGYALVMEDFGGISLAQYRQHHHLSLTNVLDLAVQIADTLHALSQQRIVHKDIKPANILIHPTTKQVKLIDFSISSRLPHETQEILHPNQLEGTLAYLSPEQTGRMNRGIDYRSDFYALGVTLYELLTGKLPFEAEDPLELVHCHLTQIAVSVDRIDPDLPLVVAQIVAKLMAKNAEDRYQSALGLKYDLEQCLTQSMATGTVAGFELGQRDFSDRFMIPEQLYGREAEVQTLLDAFNRVTEGNSELMLVAGCSGIGKTAIVNEVHQLITRQHGYFIKGKYDQFNRNLPLSAFVQAFRDLIEQLLSECDVKLVNWKRQILAAVGENGGILIKLIPELARIIGVQPPVVELAGIAAEYRFNWLFQKLIEVFASPEHPLTIFLDDLQWADPASLQLLKLSIEGKGYLLLLGAYRDNEVSPTHPLTLAVAELKQAQKIVQTIDLQSLTFDDTNRLISDTLHCSIDSAKPLAKLVDRKTQGNPFLTTKFLKALYTEGAIEFTAHTPPSPHPHLGWNYKLDRVQTLFFSEDVVEFMPQLLAPILQSQRSAFNSLPSVVTYSGTNNNTSQNITNLDLASVIQSDRESALRKSDDRYFQLLSNIPAALYQFELTADGIQRMNYLSPRFSEMFELLDLAVMTDISVLFDRLIPEDRENFYGSIQTSARSGQKWTWEGRMFMPIAKTVKWFRGESTPKYEPNGSIVWDGILMDITERKNDEIDLEFKQFAVDNVELALRQSEERYQKLSDNIPGVVYQFRLAPDGCISFPYVSSGSLELFEIEPAALMSDSSYLMDMMHPDDIPVFQQSVATSSANMTLKLFEIRSILDSGVTKWVRSISRPELQADGSIIWDGVMQDVTAEKIAQQERQRQEDALTSIVAWTAAGKRGIDFYQACTKYLADKLGVQYAFFAQPVDDSLSKSHVLSFWTGTKFLEPYEMDLSGTPCLATYQQSWGIFPADLLSRFPTATAIASIKGESYLSVAIRDLEGTLLGNLGIIDTKPLPADIAAIQFIIQLFADRIAAEIKHQADDEKLFKSQQQMQAFIDNSSAAMYLKDLEGRYLLINQICVDLTGGDAKLFLGETDDAIFPPDIAKQIRDNDRAVLQSGIPTILEESVIDPMGIARTCISSKFVLTDDAGKPYALGGVSTEITDLKQAEIALRESEKRYQKLSDNLPGVIYQFKIADGIVTFPYMSSGSIELFELESAEIVADANCLMKTIHPDDLAEFGEIVAASAQNMTFKLWEGRLILGSGTIKWIKSASRPELQPDGSIVWDGVMIDITAQRGALEERNRAQAELATSQQKYYNLIQSINGVVWEYDLATDRFSFVSDRVVSLFGYPVSYWLTQADFWQSLLYPADLNATLQAYNDAIEYHHNCEFEYRIVSADGRVIWIYDVSTLICDPDGKPISTTGLFIDISDLKQVEYQLQQSNERLELTIEELQRATRLKDEFLATMSHELRTPLNAILGMSEALQEEVFGDLNPRQLNSVSTIEQSGEHLLSLINDILDVSKISAGKLELHLTEVSPIDLCKSSLIFIKQQAFEKQIQIDTHLDSTLAHISVDERRMRQVLINLLNNAVKFTPKGGKISLSFKLEPADNCLYFAISDTGIGITSSDIAKLFQPFIQIDSALSRKYEGTGLGLVLVKQIVELHGGTVSIDSELTKGSCFTIKLPHTATPPHRNTPTPSHRNTPTPQHPHTPTILLAEDNEININTFSSYLTAKGYRVILAYNGREAIDLAQSEQPDLILMDIQMPEMDGITAIKYIRQQPSLAQIPIIAITALTMEGDRQTCLTAGANEYLAKPVSLKELYQTIQQHLN